MTATDQGVEDERIERVAAAHAALAEAQDRAYWLDRWNLDLNALMRRRGADEFRAALRVARGVARAAIHAKRRARALPERLRSAAPTEDTNGPPGASASSDATFSRSMPADPPRSSPVTDLLYDRLSAADLEEVERSLSGSPAPLVEGTDLRRLHLNLGVHHGVPAVLERTGLTQAMPPEDVHAMGRGPYASGGSLYYGDLVADGLSGAGFELAPGMRALDFGCSSGRVVRVLAAAHPEIQWHGCDPIPNAVEWAQAHLPGVAFSLSPEAPPLAYEDASFDAVYAISIWSHFDAPAALAWLNEMHRILRPGGALLLSTHGYQTIAHDRRTDRRQSAQLEEVRAALFDSGFWFLGEFGPQGDHGVANPEWGTAFLTPEWLLSRTSGKWAMTAFAPGRVEDNQDMYVLERR